MDFFQVVNDHTRTTYYVLPLTFLNRYAFGEQSNFVNAFLAPDGTQVIVEVKDKDLVPGAPWASDHFLQNEGNHFWFEVPTAFRTDVLKILDGRYSRISEEAKDQIRSYSGLNYRKERLLSSGHIVYDSDARLLALERHPDLRDRLEEILKVRIPNSLDLMSPPGEAEIWKGSLVSREDKAPA